MFDGVVIVENIAVRWQMCGKYDELVYFIKAAFAIHADVSGGVGADAHDGPPCFGPSAAVMLPMQVCV